jgi:hypothetical protein
MPKSQSKTLTNTNTTLTVSIDGDSQIGLSGTFGTVTMTDPDGNTVRTADTAAASFGTVATEFTFTLTVGNGPVLVKIHPTRVANISKFELTA